MARLLPSGLSHPAGTRAQGLQESPSARRRGLCRCHPCSKEKSGRRLDLFRCRPTWKSESNRESLLELADLRIDLDSWRPDDTARYLTNSLALAGTDKAVFDPPAIARIHQLSHGVPRRVSQLADLALVAGAGRRQDHVDSDTVESVYRELGSMQV
ncbi:MAG: hypothetical protein IID46_03050 [Planctomycetes bacterium]|nr:hypothetical protein [Planctomycetota bacterium]